MKLEEKNNILEFITLRNNWFLMLSKECAECNLCGASRELGAQTFCRKQCFERRGRGERGRREERGGRGEEGKKREECGRERREEKESKEGKKRREGREKREVGGRREGKEKEGKERERREGRERTEGRPQKINTPSFFLTNELANKLSSFLFFFSMQQPTGWHFDQFSTAFCLSIHHS